jgi:hypothetical protein
MKNAPRLGRLAAVLTTLMLLAAACGDGSGGNGDPALLPPNDNPGDTPAVSGVCAPDEPDCDDTLVVGDDEPEPLPSDPEPVIGTGGDPVSSGGMLVDGGLTVSEALATDATGIIAVQGFLLDDGTSARLCEVLAESYPPQCGGASIPVTGYEEVISDRLSNAQGVTWTDDYVSLLGEIVDGTLVVNAAVSG